VRTRRSAARAADLELMLAEARAARAVSLRQVAAALNARGIPAARGGAWTATQVRQIDENPPISENRR
jgi:hypothetical protein